MNFIGSKPRNGFQGGMRDRDDYSLHYGDFEEICPF